MDEEGGGRLITCKAYSGVSSEAMGPNDGSIWLCIRGCLRISVGAQRGQMTEVSRSPTKWKARELSSERGKHHNHVALSSGCTIVLCSDLLLKVNCRVANYNVAFQEWRVPPQTTLYTLRSRLLYWWKWMHVSRLALHILVVIGEQGSAT
jgi:hypothetical protein